MSKNSIIKGTLILTCAGFLTRIIGFFYRIYLSNVLGAEKIGIYQLVFPVYSVCFTIYASGIQTSISKLVAEQVGNTTWDGKKTITKILRIGLICSLSLATFLSLIIFTFSDFIAVRLLAEPSATNCLRILSFVFPFCGITSCINGYYYGLKKTFIPASSQLLEQVVRVIVVLLIATYLGKQNQVVTCEIAVLGLVIGEVGSNIYNIVSFFFQKKTKRKATTTPLASKQTRTICASLGKLALPLTSNRLLVSVLNSIEAVLIPIMLRQSGLSASESLSIFGILLGMAEPFIMFPSAITNSFAVLLLPTISEAHAASKQRTISKTTAIAFKYCIIIGILSTGAFITFGHQLGVTIYHNTLAGNFIATLAWLCPFLYLTTTMGSILNGLGKAHITFVNSVVGVTIRILFVIFVIPKQGIAGYLMGMLFSQLAISFLDILSVKRNIPFSLDLYSWVIIPCILVVILGFCSNKIYPILQAKSTLPPALLLLGFAFCYCVLYIVILLINKTISTKEFSQK